MNKSILMAGIAPYNPLKLQKDKLFEILVFIYRAMEFLQNSLMRFQSKALESLLMLSYPRQAARTALLHL